MLTAPKLDEYIKRFSDRRIGDEDARFTKKSWEKIKRFYKLIDEIMPYGDENEHTLYFKVPRGKLEDYGSYEEALKWGDVESKEEFIDYWKCEYPKEEKWYMMFSNHFTREKNEFYVLILNNKLVIQNEEIYDTKYAIDISNIIDELIILVKEIIDKMKNDEYNSFIEENLDKNLRYGTIRRKDYYRLFKDVEEEYFKNLTKDEIGKFEKNIKWQIDSQKNMKDKWKITSKIGRLKHLTANDFYNYCLAGYDANKYDKHEGLTAKEAYYMYADGRDDGLKDIDENSCEEFEQWFHSDRFIGHPWEVCRGGNSTHISLYVMQDEDGYYLRLDGKSFGRSVETVKFYNALKDLNAPVYLDDAEAILNMILENDKIGIVPYYDIPVYQESNFKEDKIIDFVHLDDEKEEEMIKLAKWRKLDEVYLKSKGE